MTEEQRQQARREEQVRLQAKQQQKSITYIDTDGCEVTVTTAGHVFYNVSDWY